MTANTPIFYGKPLTFDERRHMYFYDGQHVRSVTTILGVIAKPMLIPWAANMVTEHIKANCDRMADTDGGNRGYFVSEEQLELARKAHAKKKTDAGDAGSLVHKFAEDTLRGLNPVYPSNAEEVVNGCKAFEQFRAEHDLKPIDVERRIFSKQHMYAGTTDFWGHVDGRLGILDFKTSSGVWDEFWLQTAGYEVAITEELYDGDAEHLWRFLVHLDKATGEFKLYAREFSTEHREAWLNCVALDRVMQGLKKEASLKAKAEKAAA